MKISIIKLQANKSKKQGFHRLSVPKKLIEVSGITEDNHFVVTWDDKTKTLSYKLINIGSGE